MAADTLTPRLRQHSYRTYRFGRALGELEGLQVDAELLFAAAILHDSGPVNRPTALSSRCRRCGSRARSPARWAVHRGHRGHGDSDHDALQPGRTTAAGTEAYLLAAGAAVDVAGVRSWDLPPQTLPNAVRDSPRVGFKTAFADAFRAEAAGSPRDGQSS